MQLFRRPKTAAFAGISLSLCLFVFLSVWFLAAVAGNEEQLSLQELTGADLSIQNSPGSPAGSVFGTTAEPRYNPIPRFAEVQEAVAETGLTECTIHLYAGTAVIKGQPPRFSFLFTVPVYHLDFSACTVSPDSSAFMPDVPSGEFGSGSFTALPLLAAELKSAATMPWIYIDTTSPGDNLSLQKMRLSTPGFENKKTLFFHTTAAAFIDKQSFYKLFASSAPAPGSTGLLSPEDQNRKAGIITAGKNASPLTLPDLFSLPGPAENSHLLPPALFAPSFLLIRLKDSGAGSIAAAQLSLQKKLDALHISVFVRNLKENKCPFESFAARWPMFFIVFSVIAAASVFLAVIGYTPSEAVLDTAVRLSVLYRAIMQRIVIYLVPGILWSIIFIAVYAGAGRSSFFDFLRILGSRPPAMSEMPASCIPVLFAAASAAAVLLPHVVFFPALIYLKSAKQKTRI
ncbi:MAG: hypothetical protein JW904_05715 [Spirochaetales bacterium]|nr:hypothetical protein [Spirochaetales bacterium]